MFRLMFIFLCFFYVSLGAAQNLDKNSGEKGFELRDLRGEVKTPWRVPNGPTPYQWQSTRTWLSGAPDNKTAFKRAESYLGGMAYPMWEIGERFRLLYQAANNENYEYATHQLQTISRLMLYGSMARPRFKPMADSMFLDTQYLQMQDAINSRNREQVFKALENTRQSCMGCHEVTRFAYLNNIQLFKDLKPESWRIKPVEVSVYSEWSKPVDALEELFKESNNFNVNTHSGNLPDRLETVGRLRPDERRNSLIHITSVDFLPAVNHTGPEWHRYSRPFNDLRFVASTLYWGYGLVTLNGDITTPADLVGKKIGVVKRPSSLNVMAEAVLRDGLGILDKVDLVGKSFGQLPKALLAGEVDALFIPIIDLRDGAYRTLFNDLFSEQQIHWIPISESEANAADSANGFSIEWAEVPAAAITQHSNFESPNKPTGVVTLRSALFAWNDTDAHLVTAMLDALTKDVKGWQTLADKGMRDFYLKTGSPLNSKDLQVFPGLTPSLIHPAAVTFYGQQNE